MPEHGDSPTLSSVASTLPAACATGLLEEGLGSLALCNQTMASNHPENTKNAQEGIGN